MTDQDGAAREDKDLLAKYLPGVAIPEPVVDMACELGGKILGPLFGQAGMMVGDAIYRRRVRNRIKAIVELATLARESGVPLRVLAAGLPHGWACDVIEAMEQVDDDGLRRLWARLLIAPAVNARHKHPIFIETLRRLSPRDARAFHDVCLKSRGELPPPEPYSGQVSVESLSILELLGLVDPSVDSSSEPPHPALRHWDWNTVRDQPWEEVEPDCGLTILGRRLHAALTAKTGS